VCSRCSAENPVLPDKPVKRAVKCISCGAILFELDDFSDNYRITRNYRIYYISLLKTLGDIYSLLMKKNEEIRSNKEKAADELKLWQESLPDLFQEDMVSILETTADLLKNENQISDVDTRASTNDYLANVTGILEGLKVIMGEPGDLLQEIDSLKKKCRQTREFAIMLNSYLGINSQG